MLSLTEPTSRIEMGGPAPGGWARPTDRRADLADPRLAEIRTRRLLLAPLPPATRTNARQSDREQHLMRVPAAPGTEVVAGTATRRILDVADESSADLIVMGTRGRGAIVTFVMGSVAERVVRMADCPVMAVHDVQPPPRSIAHGSPRRVSTR